MINDFNFLDNEIYNDSNFIQAFKIFVKHPGYEHDYFLNKVKKEGFKIIKEDSIGDYIYAFCVVYNFGNYFNIIEYTEFGRELTKV